jgi:hypothetical protein
MYTEIYLEIWINEACQMIITKWDGNIETDRSVKER